MTFVMFYRKKCQVIYKVIYKEDLSHDVASGSDITLCNKIDKPLVVYRFLGNVMKSIITLREKWQNFDVLRSVKNAKS